MSDSQERPRRGGAARLGGRGGSNGEARRTERLAQSGDEWSTREPVNPGWRSERSTTRVAQRRGALPSSPQEFQIWLQTGGWRYAVGIGVLVLVLLIALMALLTSNTGEAALPADEPPLSGAGTTSGTLGEPQTLPPTAAPPTAPPAPSFYVVGGTDGLGLLLRPQPSTDGAALATIPDGTRVERIGEDVAGADRVWRKVRTPSGQEGYVAAEFLTAAP